MDVCLSEIICYQFNFYYKGECVTIVQLTSSVTYGGTYNTFGSFFIPQSGYVVYIQLIHYNAGFYCPDISTAVFPWGCIENGSGDVYVSDRDDNELGFRYPGSVQISTPHHLLILSNKGNEGTFMFEKVEYRIRIKGSAVSGHHTVKVALALSD